MKPIDPELLETNQDLLQETGEILTNPSSGKMKKEAALRELEKTGVINPTKPNSIKDIFFAIGAILLAFWRVLGLKLIIKTTICLSLNELEPI